MKLAFLGAFFVALFAAAGCGSSSSPDAASDGSAPTTSVPTPTNTVDPPRAEIHTSWMMFFSDQGTKSAPPQKVYAVFAREQTDDEAEIAPRVAADSACAFAGSENREPAAGGKPIPEQARILLRGAHGQGSLVAVPTTDDNVSLSVFPDGGGTCARPTNDGLILAAQAQEDTATIYGMVNDDVRSVDLIVNGKSHRAKLAENGFSVALPSGAEIDLDKVVLHKADGSKTEIPVG